MQLLPRVQQCKIAKRQGHSPCLFTFVCYTVKCKIAELFRYNFVYSDNTEEKGDYYVTFQVESGDKIELCVSSSEYSQLAEGDQGKMTFQGTRYLGFKHKGEL